MSKIWPATELTGGAFGALDAIDGALTGDGDGAMVIDPTTGTVYHYTLDATSGAPESSPDIISPDANAGTKRWLLVDVILGNVDYVGFNIDPTGVPIKEGTAFHDKVTKMLSYKTDIPGTTWNGGTESWTRVRNQTGGLLTDGTSVFGSDVITSPLTGKKTFLIVKAAAIPGQVAIPGIITSDIEDGDEGWAVTRGDVADYDTSGFTKLDFLYLPDGVDTPAGGLTNVPPTPPKYAIPVAYAMDSQVGGAIYIFSYNPVALVNATNAAVASGDPTGFHDNDNILVEYDSVARTITLTGDLKYSWRGQVKELASPWTSDAHPDVIDENYYLYSIDGKSFIWSTDLWEFSDVQAAFVTYNTLNKYALREVHGLMNWQSHEEFHQAIGTYRLSGGTLSDFTEASTTPANRRPNVASTNVKDEDIRTTNPALTSSLYNNAFLSGAGILTFDVDVADIVPLNGNIPFWNEFVSPNWQQTPMTNNQYMSIFLAAVPAASDSESQKYRYIWMQGQSAGSLTVQRSLTTADLSLGDFAGLFTEFIFTAQVIIRFTANNWQIQEVVNLTGTKATTVSSPSGNYLSVVEHNASLSGAGTSGDPLIVHHVLDYSNMIALDTTQTISPSNGEVYLSTGPDRILVDSSGGQGFWRPNIYTADIKLFGETAFDTEITATINPVNLIAGDVFSIVQYTGESIVFMYDGFDFTEVGGVTSPSRVDGHAVVAATEDFDFRANVHEIKMDFNITGTFSNASIFRDFITKITFNVDNGSAPTFTNPVGATIWTTTNLSAMADGTYEAIARVASDGTYAIFVSFKSP